MSGTGEILLRRIEEVFTASVPSWLTSFAGDPQAALDALFRMTYYHGRLNAMEPDLLLLNWASAIEAPEFHAELDRALSNWIVAEWERGDPAASAADATWQYALRAIAGLERVPQATIDALEARFEEAPTRIGMMTRNRAHDPIGWYWAALSRVQTDDRLVPHWLRLCGLAPGTPLFHGRWGLLGLRRVPNRSGDDPPAVAAAGLRQFLSALNAQVEQHQIQERGARTLAVTECQAVLRASPTKAWRREIWTHLDGLPLPAANWLTPVLGSRPSSIARTASRPWPRPDWAPRARVITTQLSKQSSQAVTQAHRLLDEQRAFTAQTGATYNLVRSLCSFSSTLISNQTGQAALAARWADEARTLEPWNSYTWTIASRAWAAAGDEEVAISLGYETLDRFPEECIVRTVLAEVLKNAGRLPEAEAIYRDTIIRFPGDTIARNGLADVLKAAGGLPEAEAIYRDTIVRFPADIFARNGLADVLKAAGRLPEAEAIYRDTMARFPESVFARNGLADVLRAAGRLRQAEAIYRDTVARFPESVPARNGLAEVLKAAGRLPEAEAIYRDTVARFTGEIFARNRLAALRKQAGDLDEAESIYQDSLSLAPHDDFARRGLREVLKAKERLSEAERAKSTGPSEGETPDPDPATAESHPHPAPEQDTEQGGSEPAPTAGEEEGRNANTLPSPPAKPSLRTVIRRAINNRGEDRRRQLEDALLVIETRLASAPMDGDALYSKLEVLLALNRVEEAESLLAALPPYLSKRPDFLAMKGRTALAKLNRQEPARFSGSVVDSVVEPWEAASRAARSLRHLPTLQKLRVGTALFDGADLERFRDAATETLSASMTQGGGGIAAKRPSRQETLASWSLDCIRHVLDLDPAADVDTSYEQLARQLRDRSDFFDSLEGELISAARRLFAPQ
ncbi:tetratricopeptide repeat protein [Actinomadura luteofluorescens]|uniref:tetratricopeptide repeat protein n=1 Tax=Actinomadura luteofluorescens TaxID=46163 RepID=UPI0034818D29